ncbi:hypothetical protein [Rahnella aceris]|uniref:hypothetical protein n=1 Tax=Rahnella sp. (strain Y9602) TaxID=2703885 RepID=UPI000DC5E650|nr:hypothetical protein [Rahnella aceris]UNK54125.1 hypothetical protein MNO10_04740 [Rahnella aceris]
MEKLNITDLRQRLVVHDNCGNERLGVAERLNIWCELNKHHGMTCRLSLGYESGPSIQRSLNDTKVLFLEIGKSLGVDVVALLEQLEAALKQRMSDVPGTESDNINDQSHPLL